VVLTIIVISLLIGCKTTNKTGDAYNPQITPSDFIAEVSNMYFSLIPERTFIYKADTDEGVERIEVETLSETRIVMGVECIVVWDRVWLDDELVEDTKDWFAQDKEGNVWYFGEDSKLVKDGEVVSLEGSWESGIDDAKPGIIMPANPKVGDKYRQEYYKGEAEDMGEVISLNEKVDVPFGSFKNCLETRDWTPLEKSSDEYKYYSPEIGGVILEVRVFSDERAELIEVRVN
jgi:hypothetical protein